MESVGTVKVWNPTSKIEIETVEGPGKVATEWTVEARSGGTCVVRVVHRWFVDTDDWDQQFEMHGYDSNSFFRILRLYLTHFCGEPSSQFQLTGFGAAPKASVWTSLHDILGLMSPVVGARIASGSTAPALTGIVERAGEAAHPEELLLRLESPAPGIAHMFAMPMGGQVLLSIRFYLYGSTAASVVETVEPHWQTWGAQHFPMAMPPDGNC
jgi:hypothetical protein